MKRALVIFGVIVGLFISFNVNAQNNVLINELDLRLAKCWSEDYSSINVNGKDADDIKEWFQSLSDSERGDIQSILLERLGEASTQEENKAFIKAAEEYLLIMPHNDDLCGDILEMLGVIYADQNDKENLRFSQERLKSFTALSGKDYSDALEKMENALTNYKPLSSDMTGIWVSDLTDKNGFPQLIFEIKDDTLAVINPASKFKYKSHFLNDFAKSQQFEVNNYSNQFLINFYSQYVSGGSRFLANTMYDFSQASGRANAEYSAQRGVSFGDALGSAVASALISSFFDALGSAFATSSSTAYVLSLEGNRVSSGILNTRIDQLELRATVDYSNQNSISNNCTFYRIDPKKDNINFVKQAPLWEDQLSDEDKKTYIKAHNKSWLFMAPCLVGVTAGLGCAVAGIVNEIKGYEEEGTRLTIIGLGTAGVFTSAMITLLFTVYPGLFKEFNTSKMNLIKEKYGVSVSLAPGYDPFTNTGGAALSMRF